MSLWHQDEGEGRFTAEDLGFKTHFICWASVQIYIQCCSSLFTECAALSEMILDSSTALLTSGNLYGAERLHGYAQRNPKIHQRLQHVSVLIWVSFGQKSNIYLFIQNGTSTL